MASSSKASTSQINQHISYPAPDLVPPASISQATSESGPKVQVKERLYIGNLHPTVDEHTLIQLFSRYGRLTKLDFLFHKSGPMKGKPRGYAFVEFADAEGAAKALGACHDKVVRGRKISVTFANQAPDYSTSSRSRPHDVKTTALSLIKTSNKPRGTESKIAALEAKLRQLEREKEVKAPEESTVGGEAGLPPRPAHLPPKPAAK